MRCESRTEAEQQKCHENREDEREEERLQQVKIEKIAAGGEEEWSNKKKCAYLCLLIRLAFDKLQGIHLLEKQFSSILNINSHYSSKSQYMCVLYVYRL